MPGWAWVVIAVAVIVAVIVIVALVTQRKRRARTTELRDRFGDEYDRTLKSAGGRRKGESELERRLEERRELQIAPVRASERDEYETKWRELEAQFEEAPLPAVARADALVTTILADRGYPMEAGFDRRAALLSVDHPETVEHYRRAHTTLRRSDDGGQSREDLYEALQHYRALMDDLVGEGRPQNPPHDELEAGTGFSQAGGGRDSRVKESQGGA
jgi:hypothetical protein